MTEITSIIIGVVVADVIFHFLEVAGNSVYDQYMRISIETEEEEDPEGYN